MRLYVHVPFCARACPYCDFDFVVGRAPPVQAYLAALDREWAARALEPGLAAKTVYVGGGTPSLLGPAGLQALGAWIRDRFDVSAHEEWTVEANPEHVDAVFADAVMSMGADRISLGVQSFEPEGLRVLGRVHDRARAEAALDRIAERGLRLSVDLIVGWPGQDPASVRRDIDVLLAHGVRHVSIYALTIESGTPWPKLVARGKRSLPQADDQADCLIAAEEALVAAGLEHYEIASYGARERARHNLAYWTWRDYLGLGPSAASATYGADGSVARRTGPRGFGVWAKDPGRAGAVEHLDGTQAAAEGLWLGLRRLEGMDVKAYLDRFPAVDRAWLDRRIATQLERRNLVWDERKAVLRVARDRWLLHDDICAALV